MTNGANKGNSRVHGFPTINMGSQHLVSTWIAQCQWRTIRFSNLIAKTVTHTINKDSILTLPFLVTPITNYTSARTVAPPPPTPFFRLRSPAVGVWSG